MTDRNLDGALRALDFPVTAPRCVGKDCGRPATWALVILCPAWHGSIMCGLHHDAWVRRAEATPTKRAVCSECPDNPELPSPFYRWSTL